MKRTILMSIIAAGTLALLAGCNSMKKLQRDVIETAVVGQVTPAQLEAVNGKIDFTYVVKFPPKQFDKKMVLKITPRMQYGNKVEKLPPLYLQGENVKNSSYQVVAYKSATTVTQKMSMNFKEGMQQGVLWADIEAMQGDKAFMLSPVILNKNGVKVWQSYTIKIDGINYMPVMAETILEDIPAAQLGVIGGYILFPLAQAKITDAQQHSAVMNRAEEAMKKVLGNPKATITNMLLYTSSSPEGVERMNKNLTANRYKAAKAFFEKDLGIAGLPVVQNAQFVIPQMVTENWEGLYLLLNDSDIPNKAQIISEIKSAANNNKREAILESYVKKIPALKNEILPLLRRADFFVFYTVPDTIQQETQIVYYMPQVEEKTPTVGTQWNWQLLNDLAVVAIQNKEYAKAQKLLEAAIVLKQDPAIMNNLGIAYAKQGNTSKAKDMLDKAQVKKEAKYNMGLILMQQGDYAKAVSYLKGMPSIYLAYSQLRAGDNRAALDTFKQLKPTNATEYYLMAVAAARVKDTPVMTTALQKAFQINPELKKQASTDIEFRNYINNPVFG
ncbi:tetratricopeptide repeat protein [Odoribacter lunatus]|uniref:tetratricopeptide repeat protein n=1 Tax=Odoribacter lunatus TaxID=2941335 RepID=UPI00204134EA|nr:tetratricopeptide repeat protein [Odoribacter lunatus]